MVFPSPLNTVKTDSSVKTNGPLQTDDRCVSSVYGGVE